MSCLVLFKIALHWNVLERSRLCSLQSPVSLQSSFSQTLGVRRDVSILQSSAAALFTTRTHSLTKTYTLNFIQEAIEIKI